jgi:hypothetical protein
LAGIDARTKQFEFENGLQLTQFRWNARFEAQAALSNTPVGFPFWIKFTLE